METINQIANLAKHEHPELEQKGFFRHWYYKPTQSPVRKEEYFFPAENFTALKSALEHKHFEALKQLHPLPDGNVKMVIIASKDGKFGAVQLHRYRPFEFAPETDIMVLKEDEIPLFLAALKSKKS